MSKGLDSKEREEEILALVVESYIRKSTPVSSTYLCDTYHLPYSSATVRNVMEALEKNGFLSHIHTSSGRVPTQEGFKYYVGHLQEEDFLKEEYPISLDFSSLGDVDEVINYSLDILAEISGYTSLVAVAGKDVKIILKGARFILQQPEFEDINRLRNLFYALEVKINQLQNLLFNYVDEKIKILIGDDIGFEDISECSLIISGSREKKLSFSLGLLGPMRMDYVKGVSCLYAIKNQLSKVIGELL
jgi:transcriptional regulator of heat shock response